VYRRIRETLYALPSYFKPETFVAGLLATDIFALNSALGATIEAQVVDALNDLRTTWDPGQAYSQYSFVRQPQTFPDVRLQRFRDDGTFDIIMGVELKGWYLLAKEGEPSFRMTASPDSCAPADLIAIYPWVLSNIISGHPQLFRPFVLEARYAAERRNYHWEHERETEDDKSVILATGAKPYPAKPDLISDHAAVDGGKNFGRLARTSILDEYKIGIDKEGVAGIPAGLWRKFFKAFIGGQDLSESTEAVDRLVRSISPSRPRLTSQQLDEIASRLRAIAEIISS
jgi:hypothetical protein